MGYAPIESAPTGVTAFVGRSDRGPIGRAVAIDGPDAADRLLGSPSAHGDLAHLVELFFANGGERAYAIRTPTGEDGGPGDVDREALIGSAEAGTGVHAVAGIDDVDVICLPDAASLAPGDAAAVFRAAAEVAEVRRAIVLIDVPDRMDDPEEVLVWADESGIRGRNAAMYLPRCMVADPRQPGRFRALPPSGVVAGVYARTDATRAVWSSPAGAGARVRGIVDLTAQVTRHDQDLLLPAGINTLRHFVGHGPLVWGARTLEHATGDVEWRYVAVRRFALMVERSLEAGLQWVTEEPNTAPTWTLVRGAVERFLLGLWRQGAFPASRPDQAFHVRCGLGATMTEDDVRAGRLIVELGLAPTRPAEFVSLRLGFGAAAPVPDGSPPGGGPIVGPVDAAGSSVGSERDEPVGSVGTDPSSQGRRADGLSSSELATLRELILRSPRGQNGRRERGRRPAPQGPPRRGLPTELPTGSGADAQTLVVVAGGTPQQHRQAAQVLADGLGVGVLRIDLAQVVGRFIGETEKNLARLLAAAEAQGSVVLFDEADALFGRRSGSRAVSSDPSDREVEVIRARLAAHPGVVVLATSDPGAARDRPGLLRPTEVVVLHLDEA